MQNSSLSVNVQGLTKCPLVDPLSEVAEEFLNQVLRDLDIPELTLLSRTQLNASCSLKLQCQVEQVNVVDLSLTVSLKPLIPGSQS